MVRTNRFSSDPTATSLGRQRGYILLTLMLFFTLLAISALAVLPKIAQEMKRDREEEMIHRGVQYTRAVQRYYKKFGRYPTRLEDLESTNNLRFLRKRYKDPMTGKDFKLLRVGDPALAMMGFGAGLGQGGLQGLQQGLQGMQQGNRPGFVASPNGGVRPAGPGDANMPQVTGLPGSANTVQQNAGDENQDASTPAKSDSASSSDSASGLGGQVFGGGPILGVVSASNDTSIREFNDKKHYKEWPFIYDPSGDRGGLFNMPTIPGLNQGGSNMPGQGSRPGAAPGPQGPGPTGQPPGPPKPSEPPEE